MSRTLPWLWRVRPSNVVCRTDDDEGNSGNLFEGESGVENRRSYRGRARVASETTTTTNAFLAFAVPHLIVDALALHEKIGPDLCHRGVVYWPPLAFSSGRASRSGLGRNQAGRWLVDH